MRTTITIWLISLPDTNMGKVIYNVTWKPKMWLTVSDNDPYSKALNILKKDLILTSFYKCWNQRAGERYKTWPASPNRYEVAALHKEMPYTRQYCKLDNDTMQSSLWHVALSVPEVVSHQDLQTGCWVASILSVRLYYFHRSSINQKLPAFVFLQHSSGSHFLVYSSLK